MALTRPQRIALGRADRKYGCDLTTIHTNTADLLTASGLTTISDPSDTGTWRLIITPAGQKAIRDHDNPPIIEITRKDTVRLMRGARMPHPDPTIRRSIPEPEIVPPSTEYVRKTRITNAQARESFRKDLEAERRKRRSTDRINRMFRDAA